MCLSKIAGYKINIQKSIIFINTCNEQFGKKENNPTCNSIKKNKIKINLTKTSYNYTLETTKYYLKKKMKEDLNKGKGIPCVRLEDLISLIWQYSLNWSTDSTWSLSRFQLPFFFFAEIDKLILKFIRKFKRLRLAETISDV